VKEYFTKLEKYVGVLFKVWEKTIAGNLYEWVERQCESKILTIFLKKKRK